jgi:hypothetical protein
MRGARPELTVTEGGGEQDHEPEAKSSNEGLPLAPDGVDGAVACAMAVARAASGENSGSIYSNAEERPKGLLFV